MFNSKNLLCSWSLLLLMMEECCFFHYSQQSTFSNVFQCVCDILRFRDIRAAPNLYCMCKWQCISSSSLEFKKKKRSCLPWTPFWHWMSLEVPAEKEEEKNPLESFSTYTHKAKLWNPAEAWKVPPMRTFTTAASYSASDSFTSSPLLSVDRVPGP